MICGKKPGRNQFIFSYKYIRSHIFKIKFEFKFKYESQIVFIFDEIFGAITIIFFFVGSDGENILLHINVQLDIYGHISSEGILLWRIFGKFRYMFVHSYMSLTEKTDDVRNYFCCKSFGIYGSSAFRPSVSSLF